MLCNMNESLDCVQGCSETKQITQIQRKLVLIQLTFHRVYRHIVPQFCCLSVTVKK